MDERRENGGRRDRIDKIAESYERTDATVLGLLRNYRVMLWLMVVLFAFGALSTVYFYEQNQERLADNRKLALRADRLARQNQRAIMTAQQAIVTGCDLLVDIAKQAGTAPARKGESKASRINRLLFVTIIDEVLRTAPPSVRARVTALYHRLLRAGPIIRLPKCSTVGKRPPPSKGPS